MLDKARPPPIGRFKKGSVKRMPLVQQELMSRAIPISISFLFRIGIISFYAMSQLP